MLQLLLAFSLQLPGGAPAVDPARDAWLAPDKVKHFLVSAFIQGVGYGALRTTGMPHGAALAAATAGTVAVGVARELHDRRTKGAFSARDLAWDVAGAAAASALLNQTVR